MEKKTKNVVLWQLACVACGGIDGSVEENYVAK
jgi:hypothetical protein